MISLNCSPIGAWAAEGGALRETEDGASPGDIEPAARYHQRAIQVSLCACACSVARLGRQQEVQEQRRVCRCNGRHVPRLREVLVAHRLQVRRVGVHCCGSAGARLRLRSGGGQTAGVFPVRSVVHRAQERLFAMREREACEYPGMIDAHNSPAVICCEPNDSRTLRSADGVVTERGRGNRSLRREQQRLPAERSRRRRLARKFNRLLCIVRE